MRIVGVTTPVGAPVVEFEIAHGSHPTQTLAEQGFAPIRPLAVHGADDDITFTYLVAKQPPRPPRTESVHNEEPEADQQPTIRQRLGSYAIVTSSRGLLSTVNSSLTSAPNTWALPGGGIDPGETPAEAVVREVFEETGQHIAIGRLLTLDSDHWIGRSTTGVLEDFHALRVLYAATCETPSEPVVHDLGGSTAGASWVPLDSWRNLHWTISSRALLTRFARLLES